jgi:hypothetical protein
MTTIKSVSDFNKKLSVIGKADEKLHDDIQACIVFAVKQVNEHEQFTPLNDLMAAVGGLRTALNKAVRQYLVLKHNIAFDAENNTFGKKAKGKPVELVMKEGAFYDAIKTAAEKRAKAAAERKAAKANDAGESNGETGDGTPFSNVKKSKNGTIAQAERAVLDALAKYSHEEKVAALKAALADLDKKAAA